MFYVTNTAHQHLIRCRSMMILEIGCTADGEPRLALVGEPIDPDPLTVDVEADPSWTCRADAEAFRDRLCALYGCARR